MHRAALVMLLSLMTLIAAPAAAKSLTLRPAEGPAPLELSPGQGYQRGRAVLENRGARPVQIVGVAMREGGELDPRLPEAVRASLAHGGERAELAPGASLLIDVEWRLGRERRARELYGHLMVETAEGERVALGVHAELGGIAPLVGTRPLSWLVFLPLLGLVALAAARAFRYEKTRQLRLVGVAVALGQLALALLVASRFDVGFSRYDGNDGLQLIERAVLWPAAGIEYALGVDGASLPLLLLVPLLVLAASLVSYTVDRRLEKYWTLVLLTDVGSMGALCATDLALWLAFLSLALLAVLALVFHFGGADAPGATRYAAAWLGVALVVLVLGTYHLAGQAGQGLLSDGRWAARTLSLPELSHVDLARQGDRIFGMHPVKVLFCLWFVGLGTVAGVPPAHGWLSRAFAAAPAPVAILLVAVRSVACCALMRVLYAALPQGAAWAAPMLAGLGVIGAAWAAISALAATDLGRFAARLSAMHVALVMLGLSSLTATGLHGVLMLAVSHGLVIGLLLVTAGALRDRVGTDSLETLRGLGRELPRLAVVAAVAVFGAVAAPGTSGFVGALLACVGAFPAQRIWALAALLALVLATLAAVRTHARLFAGDVPETWRAHPRLEPYGGHFPPLTRRELSALIPLAMLIVGLGLWPRPLLRLTATASLDYAAFVNPPGPTEVVRAEERPRSVAVASAAPDSGPMFTRGLCDGANAPTRTSARTRDTRRP